MGCDIHPHIEVKINGKWYHYSVPLLTRCYALFTRICGVRRYDNEIPQFSEPRGVPDDASEITQIDYRWDGSDAHSATWLNKSEFNELIKWHEAYLESREKGKGFTAQWEQWGYLNGNSFLKYSGSNAPEYEDVRFICWFDN